MIQAPTLEEWAVQWRARAHRTDALTPGEWSAVKEAVIHSYVGSGLNPPAAVIRTRSPREAMAMALAHQADQPMSEVNAATRVTAVIREHQQVLLSRVRSFSGAIAARVDGGVLSPRAWGEGLHPDMRRSPCTGNLRPGVAAELQWVLDHGQAPAATSIRTGIEAIVGRCAAGPSRFLRDLAIVSGMPTHFAADHEGRPHNDGAPAIVWPDGTALNFWHGTRVPADFFRWSVERALAEVNVEVRRCAFEHIGVERLEDSLTLLAEAPDPGNAPHLLRLYDLPRPWLNGRLLVVDNASVDKGGHRRRFHIFVPHHITDPVEAAANSFGMTADQYKQMQRST